MENDFMPDESPAPFVVEFSKRTARMIEYRDCLGSLEFSFDVLNAEGKSLVLEHHAAHSLRLPQYDLAFGRCVRFLESCGYRVETFGASHRAVPLSAREVSSLVDAELAGMKQAIPRPVDILTLPQRAIFVSDADKSEWNLWLVLDSRSGAHGGYKIVFDDQSKQFGLATAQNIFVGFWGSFAQTLEALGAVA
jgi:hypothetical protein